MSKKIKEHEYATSRWADGLSLELAWTSRAGPPEGGLESAGLMELSCTTLQNLKPIFSVAPAETAAIAAEKRDSW